MITADLTEIAEDCEAAAYAACTAAEAMELLTDVPSDQDWGEGSTTYTFRDGSRLWVCGTDVEVVSP